jgi:hypothetical protein
MREVKVMNREAQERWDNDGGAILLDLDVQKNGPGWSMIDSAAFVGAHDRAMLLDQLEVANKYFAESEHRIARQQNLISNLRANGQPPLLAIAFLRSLQASGVMHRADRSRLQRALAILDESLGTIQQSR